jgi:hypothetical protein
VKFKEERVREEFTQAPIFLQVVCADFELLSRFFGIEPVVTRVREVVPGSSGVHEAGRAVDFRDSFSGVFVYSEAQRKVIVDALNEKYSRKDGKPTCLWHSFNNGPQHFHVQIAADMTTYKRRS